MDRRKGVSCAYSAILTLRPYRLRPAGPLPLPCQPWSGRTSRFVHPRSDPCARGRMGNLEGIGPCKGHGLGINNPLDAISARPDAVGRPAGTPSSPRSPPGSRAFPCLLTSPVHWPPLVLRFLSKPSQGPDRARSCGVGEPAHRHPSPTLTLAISHAINRAQQRSPCLCFFSFILPIVFSHTPNAH